MNEKKNWISVLKLALQAIVAALTAIGVTSCSL
jgi:hypothetical protein